MKCKIGQILKIVIINAFLLFTLIHLYRAIFDNTQENSNKKYILLWTPSKKSPYKFMGLGQKVFKERNCSYTNCFVALRKEFSDYTKYHTVIFIASEIKYYQSYEFPKFRHPHQKYVLSSIESSQYYPICSEQFERYFNWTWSFRLDSDCRLEYIAIRDVNNTVIGPNTVMHWMKVKDMQPVSIEFQNSLKTKTKAAAWFVSNCLTESQREIYVTKLKFELAVYNYTVDIYSDCVKRACKFYSTIGITGQCNSITCPKTDRHCMQMIKSDYYFYLAFENSFNEDYVTEKLLHALKNNAIPIVYGGANYTRFMPDGIYLNAMKLSPEKLAKEMDKLIKNSNIYTEYFKWQNHYSYHGRSESADTDDFCAFCKLLNDEEKFRKKSVVENFRKWWNSPDFCWKNNINGLALQ